MFHEVWELERFQTAKVIFKVTQGQWHWCHSIGHEYDFLSMLPCNYVSCAFNEILSLVSKNLRRSRDTLHILFGDDI